MVLRDEVTSGLARSFKRARDGLQSASLDYHQQRKAPRFEMSLEPRTGRPDPVMHAQQAGTFEEYSGTAFAHQRGVETPLNAFDAFLKLPQGRPVNILTVPETNMFCLPERHCTLPDYGNLLVGQSGPCVRRGGGRRCQSMGCTKSAEGPTLFCIAHNGGYRCQHPGCTKGAEGPSMMCKAHGGRRCCIEPDCRRVAAAGGKCKRHGGGKRCKKDGCRKKVLTRGLCDLHSRGRLCTVDGCTTPVVSRKLCKRHGGGRRCEYEGCNKASQGQHGLCKRHSSKTLCHHDGCRRSRAEGSDFCKYHHNVGRRTWPVRDSATVPVQQEQHAPHVPTQWQPIRHEQVAPHVQTRLPSPQVQQQSPAPLQQQQPALLLQQQPVSPQLTQQQLRLQRQAQQQMQHQQRQQQQQQSNGMEPASLGPSPALPFQHEASFEQTQQQTSKEFTTPPGLATPTKFDSEWPLPPLPSTSEDSGFEQMFASFVSAGPGL